MPHRNSFASLLFSFGLIFCVAGAASATTFYEYTGNNYVFRKRLITTSMSVNASIEVAVPLAAGLNNVDLSPSILSFVVSDGVRILSDADSFSSAEFRISTDGSGNITDWAVFLASPFAVIDRVKTCSGAIATISPTGCGVGIVLDSTQFPVRNFGSVADNPGSWSIAVPPNSPPDCSAATADAAELWPPDQGYESVSILGVTDPDGDVVTVVATDVFQDEDTNNIGDGNTCPDAVLDGVGSVVKLRRERSGIDEFGRTYHVEFSADDGQGGTCTGSVVVCVPHDGSGFSCSDEGPLFDSQSCPECVF